MAGNDLVAHCGESAAGEFIYSLNATDIATGWTETRAILGKSQRAVVDALQSICESLPLTLLGIDSDTPEQRAEIAKAAAAARRKKKPNDGAWL